jgi:hypothetical protein
VPISGGVEAERPVSVMSTGASTTSTTEVHKLWVNLDHAQTLTEYIHCYRCQVSGGVGAEWTVECHEHRPVHMYIMVRVVLSKRLTTWPASYRCQVSGGVGAEWPVECHEHWRFHEGTHTLELLGLMALHPDIHLAKHTERQPDDARRQHGIWTLQGMNQ